MSQLQSMIESFVESNTPSKKEERIVLPENQVYPYFTPEEVLQLEGYYSDKVNEENRNLFEGVYAGDMGYHRKSWLSRVSDLDEKLKVATEPEDIDNAKQEIIDLGWNPEIGFTQENQIKARLRQEAILNASLRKVNIINASSIDDVADVIQEANNKPELYPIHVVLSKGDSLISGTITRVTNGDFSHAGLALDNNMEKIYSFNFENGFKFGGGFSLESIKQLPPNNRLAVYTIFVTEPVYLKINDNIQHLLNNIKNTKYNLINLIMFPFKNIKINNSDSMICSQFVDNILKLANFNITGIDSSKVSPNGLYFAIKNNSKVYKVFDGIVKDFDTISFNKTVTKIKRHALVANESCIIESVVTEARQIPFEINQDGDVLLTNPFPDYDDEYAASHKLLLQYEKAGNLDGVKYELARLYYMNYIIEKQLYHNKQLSKKEKNIKTRARVLNDFNKYLKYVLSKDKNFNFAEYYEQSPFYVHTIQVKSSTIGKVKDLINYIL